MRLTIAITMTTADSTFYSIRPYQSGDEALIAALFALVFGQNLPLTAWRWKYTGSLQGTPHALVATDAQGAVVAHAGAVALRGWYQGQEVPFFQICDVMVHPQQRGHWGTRNIFTTLLRELLDRLAAQYPQAFCYGFPGRRPFLLGERAQVYGRLERAVETTLLPTGRRLPLLRVISMAWDDPCLDRLWQRLAPHSALLLIRDRRYVRWRYADHPLHHYELLGLSLGGYTLGWVVTRRDGTRWLIVDLLLPRRWLRPALAALRRAAGGRGLETLSLWLPPGWREQAGGQQQETEVVTTQMIRHAAFDPAQVRTALYYTMGDLDIF